MFIIIIANGPLKTSPELAGRLKKADLIIAADGGANHCLELGITPDILLGDLDSIKPDALAKFEEKQNVEIVQYPRKKDATDLELGLDLALKKGGDRVLLLAALGGRWDMSLANIMLAASSKYSKLDILLQGQDCSMRILHPGKPYKLSSTVGQQVSLLPLGGDVHGVTLTGFEYPLTNHTITFGSTLGISNGAASSSNEVQLEEGVLLCVLLD